MSSPITPIVALSGPTPSITRPTRPESGEPLSGLVPGEKAFAIWASHSEPPREVLDLLGAAGERHSELLDDGRELRFLAAESGAPRVELHDLAVGTSRQISIVEAFELLDGGAAE
jgi:hypothetical protein